MLLFSVDLASGFDAFFKGTKMKTNKTHGSLRVICDMHPVVLKRVKAVVPEQNLYLLHAPETRARQAGTKTVRFRPCQNLIIYETPYGSHSRIRFSFLTSRACHLAIFAAAWPTRNMYILKADFYQRSIIERQFCNQSVICKSYVPRSLPFSFLVGFCYFCYILCTV